jgi:WD40 repeat protein
LQVWTSRTHDCKAGCICTKKDTYPYVVTKPECPVAGHSEAVLCVAFSPDGTRVVSGSRDNLVKIWNWNAETKTLRKTGLKVSSFVPKRSGGGPCQGVRGNFKCNVLC